MWYLAEKAGANTEHATQDGMTPLIIAAREGRKAVVECLLRKAQKNA